MNDKADLIKNIDEIMNPPVTLETRTVEQVKVFGLILNTFGKAEDGRLVALASTEEALKNWHDSQMLEQPERIGRWLYNYKEGELRNCNPDVWMHVSKHVFGHGWFVQWVNVDELRTDIFRVDF